MKEYLFVDGNNGHFATYHPFFLERSLTQEKANAIMLKYPNVRRMGMTLDHFLQLLDESGYKAAFWNCPCCGNQVKQILNPNVDDWDLIEGITGNY